MDGLKKILVAVTGVRLDREVVELACQIGKRHKAVVYAAYVIEVPHTLPLDAEMPDRAAQAEEALDGAEGIADDANYEVETVLLQSRSAGVALVDEAVDKEVDLIVLGLPYRTRLGSFDLGSVASYVLKNAPCRVMVVRQRVDKGPELG